MSRADDLAQMRLNDPSRVLGDALAELISRAIAEVVNQNVDHDAGQALTVKQVSDRLAADRKTVYRLMDDGDLPWFTLRSQRRVLLADLLAYIEKSRS